MTTTLRAMGFPALLLLLGVLQPAGVFGQDPDGGIHGEYAVTIATEDVPPELIGGASLIGRWQITFGEDGAYVLGRQDVGPLVRGQFETDGARLVLRGESGVIACETDPENGAPATYEWEFTDGKLLLMAIEESCARRRLLLTTRTLSSFVACPALLANRPEPTVEGSAKGSSDVGRGVPAAATPTPSASPTSEIDTLLKQMSDCWATRQPERFLQLLSAEDRATQTPQDEDGERRFTLNMGAPIAWELAGDVEVIDDAHATATVRQTIGDRVDFVHYAFVLENGSWRWDGAADNP